MGTKARQNRKAAGEEDDILDGPERTCAVTRGKDGPEGLIRFVADPDGVIVPDLANRLPGRGVWVANNRATIEKAARTNAFARSLKTNVSVPEGLAERVEHLLARRALDALSLANKAGAVVAGFTKVDVAIGKGGLEALVHASDASQDGCGKLDGKWRSLANAMAEAGEAVPPLDIVRDLNSAELSLALGRSNVIHAALRKSGAARKFLREAERLRRFRSDGPSETAEPSSTGLDTERV